MPAFGHVLASFPEGEGDNCEERFKLEVELLDGILEAIIYSKGNEPVATVKDSKVELHGWIRKGITDAGVILTN
jgi:hypothetical protein